MTKGRLFDLSLRNPKCRACKMWQHTDHVCEMGKGPADAKIMVVSKMPLRDTARKQIAEALGEVGIDPGWIYHTSATRCQSWDVDPSAGDIKTCRTFLEAEVAHVRPKWILTLGNEALLSVTGHSGIMKYRGKLLNDLWSKGRQRVVATLAPAAVTRNPGYRSSWLGDLRFFAAQILGQSAKVDPPKVVAINTKQKFEALKRLLADTELLSFDIETTGADEFEEGASIVSLAGTSVLKDGRVKVWALPLYHPQSPFRNNWKIALKQLKPFLEAIPKAVAHNGKFDARWLRQFGVAIKVTFDTMLSCHILNENELKGLEPQATSRLGVASWKSMVNTRDLLTEPLPTVLKYNALDTYYTYHLYLEIKAELLKEPRLLRLFRMITTPANNLLIGVERRGVWIDRERLATNTKIAFEMRDEIDHKLMEWVPDRELWPKNSKGRTFEVNFNASNFARWWLFEHLGLPILARGKTKDDGSPGMPSMREGVMLELRGHHPVVNILLERVKWQKYCSSFLTTYDEIADENDRIHTTFKLAGTVTGRLSSGKADADKITARKEIRGVNLQQVPRDPFIRGLFGAAPGYLFVEADFSQIELRVAAFISRERTMMHLYQTGQDIHRATAAWVLGKPADAVTAEDRKKAKAVNFGFVYGMGAPKFVRTAFEQYEVVFSLDEAKEIRRLFFEQFRGLLGWHARQKRLVNENARVSSPIGRVRHLPDIYSPDDFVRGEAERQAINSPVQSFASDMTQLSFVLIADQFKRLRLDAHCIGTVHDSLLFEVREDHVGKVLPIVKSTMENLPLRKKFGIELDLPIIADIKVGTHWGDARELSEEEVYRWMTKK